MTVAKRERDPAPKRVDKVVGWRVTLKIAEVDGLIASPEIERMFEEFESNRIGAEQRREIIRQRFSKAQ